MDERKMMAIAALVAAGIIALFWSLNRHLDTEIARHKAEREEAKKDDEFLTSEKTHLPGSSQYVYIVKHKKTGKRYVVNSGGGVQPLDQQEPE